jgi:hypothetical protein
MTAFPAPIFTKFINAQQNYIQISYNKFHPNQKMNVENVDWNSFKPIYYILHVLIFTKLTHTTNFREHLLHWILSKWWQKMDNTQTKIDLWLHWSIAFTVCILTNQNWSMALHRDFWHKTSPNQSTLMESSSRNSSVPLHKL